MRRKGEQVIMTNDALDNYGEHWRGITLEITHVATKYMPSVEFFAKGMPKGYHPGYDGGAGGALYDLKRADTGEAVNFSLYDWEVKTDWEVNSQ